MRTLVMGVLNVTPDSFFDGGRYLDHAPAVRRGEEMLAEGADIIDVGGESTRPGSLGVSEEEELGRVLPVVEALARNELIRSGAARISIDTTKPVVARAAADAGARIVNDVSSSLGEVAAEAGAAFVAVHCKGTPRTMQDNPQYEDVVAEVSEYLAGRAAAAEMAGVEEVFVDPGIGFGKTAQHNLALLKALPRLTALDWPVLVGCSRKAFIGRIAAGGAEREPLGLTERFEGSLACAVWCMSCGVSVVRAHDVRATVEASRLVEATAEAMAAAGPGGGP